MDVSELGFSECDQDRSPENYPNATLRHSLRGRKCPQVTPLACGAPQQCNRTATLLRVWTNDELLPKFVVQDSDITFWQWIPVKLWSQAPSCVPFSPKPRSPCRFFLVPRTCELSDKLKKFRNTLSPLITAFARTGTPDLVVCLNRGVLPNAGENPNQLGYLRVVKYALDTARVDIRER